MKYFCLVGESNKKKVDKWLKKNPEANIQHIEVESGVGQSNGSTTEYVIGMWFIYTLEK